MNAQAIINDLIQKIYAGKINPGDLVMSINQAARFYNMSANSIKKAYDKMVYLGVLFKKQGIGHFVATDWDANIISSPSLATEIFKTSVEQLTSKQKILPYQDFLELIKNKKWKIFIKYYYVEERLAKLNIVAINSSLIPSISQEIVEGSFISWLYEHHHFPASEVSEIFARDSNNQEETLLQPKNKMVIEENIITYDKKREVICFAKWIINPEFFRIKRYKGNY